MGKEGREKEGGGGWAAHRPGTSGSIPPTLTRTLMVSSMPLEAATCSGPIVKRLIDLV